MLISLSFFFSFFFFEKKKPSEAISPWFVRMERNIVRLKIKQTKAGDPGFSSGCFHHRSDRDGNHRRRAVLSVHLSFLPSFLNDLPQVAPVFSLVVCGNGSALAECLQSLTDYLLILSVFLSFHASVAGNIQTLPFWSVSPTSSSFLFFFFFPPSER